MAHPAYAYELFEILGYELWAIVADDARPSCRALLFGPLYDQLHIRLFHALADLPMDHIAAIAVQNRAQVVERATNVYIADIYVPVLMRRTGLLETLAPGRALAIPSP